MRTFVCSVAFSTFFMMMGSALASSQNQYEPPQPYATVCTCANINGMCNADCTDLQCDSNFGNCDGDLTNGCEAHIDLVSSCGACGLDCNSCHQNATCNAGVCGGKPRADGTACHIDGCVRGGACMEGSCICPDGLDMAKPPLPTASVPDMAHGHDLPGDCSFTGGGTATASVLLLLSAIVLLYRRRRPN